jgi:hypothetical protein
MISNFLLHLYFQSISLKYSYILFLSKDINFIIGRSLSPLIKIVLLQVSKIFLMNLKFFRLKKNPNTLTY